jgi:hypothetical protein
MLEKLKQEHLSSAFILRGDSKDSDVLEVSDVGDEQSYHNEYAPDIVFLDIMRSTKSAKEKVIALKYLIRVSKPKYGSLLIHKTPEVTAILEKV